MKASFFEFNVATTGLMVAKNAINVAGHNIANAETPGYSRQVALMKTNTPLTFYDGRGMIGTGAQVYGIGQIRSAYMDQKYWKENSVLGEYTVKNEQLTLTESIFNSLATSSTTTYFDDFFGAVSDLSTTANEETYRTAVLQSAESLAKQVNSIYSSLEKQQGDTNEEIKSTVAIVNSIGIQIKNLNEQIAKYEMDGSNANDLRDQRALLVDELSSYVNVSVKEYELDTGSSLNDKRFKVQINGVDFVNHFDVNTLGVEEREEAVNPEDVHGLYDIVWTGTNAEFDMYHPNLTGQLKALIDLRDGNNGEYMGGTIDSVTGPDAGKCEIKVTDPSRIDLQENGGKVTITDPSTNRDVEYTYDKLTKDFDEDTGELLSITFTVTDMSATQADNIRDASGDVNLTSGETNGYKGIPYYMSRLNDLVRTFSRAINEGKDHNGDLINGVKPYSAGVDKNNKPYDGGYDKDGNPSKHLMFTFKDENGKDYDTISDYSDMTAKNFQVSEYLQDNPKALAASDNATGGESNNEIILSFSKIKSCETLFDEGSLNDYVTAVATELGVDLNQAEKFEESYTEVLTSIEGQRLSIMGVDLDEESVNLVKFNQLYQSSAKLINVINEIYDTLINRLGV